MNDVFSQPTDQQALALTHAIALQESGNGSVPNYNAVGDAGTSHGAYQWQPGNFEAAAKSAGLDPTDFSPVNQDKVAYSEVKAYKDKGYDPGQIASLWNSGSPNNWQNHSGTVNINGKQIKYDTPNYVKGVQNHYQQLVGTQTQNQNTNTDTSIPDKGFLQNESESVANRLGQGGQAISDTFSGKINPLSGILQTAGTAAGGITDLAGNALSAIIPDFIKKPVEQGIQGLVGAAANTEVGKSAIKGVQDFSTAHPELAGDIGAIGNIASVIPVVSGLGAAKDLVGGLIGKALGKDALSATIDSVSPEIKAGTKAGAASVKSTGTSKSILGNISRNIDPQLKETASVVKEAVPNFDKLPTFTDKVNAAKQGIVNFAQQLRTNLRGDVQPILTSEDMANLDVGIKEEIASNPLLKGDAGASAQNIFDYFKKALPQGRDANMEDVLNARQKTDNWISSITRGNAFDPKTENALSVGLRAVRQGANNLMESKVPSAGVKTLLRKQTLLYDAIDNMAPKADREVGTGLLGRMAARHPSITRGLKYSGGALLGGLGIGEAQNLMGGK